MDKLQKGTRTVYQPTNHKHEGFWHQDPGFTINCTLVGQGGLWIPNDKIFEKSSNFLLSDVRQFEPQHIVIYQGNGKDNLVGPLYHSPPIRESSQERILMQLYL